MNYRYTLEKYKNVKTSKHECPACNARSSFVYYIDTETGSPVHSTVGKCDHKDTCGYHYTPREYYADNGVERERQPVKQPQPVEPPKPASYIPYEYIEQSYSYNSNFVRFLCEIFNEQQVRQIVERYSLGATKAKEVIFWQIDITGKVRTGKVIQYNAATGKRVKGKGLIDVDWVHKKLERNKKLNDYNLIQCFFGEHLLRLYPDATVAIVEGEKSAAIASELMPEFIWLAAGNVEGLKNINKSSVLKGRRVVLYPDLSKPKEGKKSAFEEWSINAQQIEQRYGCRVIVSDLLEKHATEQQRIGGCDIADYIIDERKSIGESLLNRMIRSNPSVRILIDRLDLEEVEVS